MELMGHIENIHQNSRKLYGAPRVTEAMKNLGLPVSRSTVSRWMSEAGLAAKTKRRFRVVTTDSNHKLPLAANILDRQFSPAEPGAVLASDITYIATMEGWLYLAITLDLFSRRVVGWSLDSTMEEKLVLNAITMALGRTDMRVGNSPF
jgi:putative transposase